ncbi:hypothetical protein J2S67_000564 [Pseudoglutamicibacter albus]|uniref:DUF1707 domain-containing protein n=1 Tax=Pseudoglutamicibacter albus TaxID=98671 RepID=A0ABU1YZW2_9MICC|nr:hypothetical protein [Pseudoglutamicibacter albus]MDR7293296.1 hypothetical protein [Pseudoglutamicibacter albus]
MKDRRDDDAEWADLVARLEAMDPGVTDAEAQAQRKAEELEDFFASQPFYPITKADADSTAEPPSEPSSAVHSAGSGAHLAGPRDWSPIEDAAGWGEDTDYVPEDPPSIFSGRPDRVLAWSVVVALPLVILLLVMFKVSIAPFMWWVFIAGELGALLYLGWTLPRHPRDPWDDGARV